MRNSARGGRGVIGRELRCGTAGVWRRVGVRRTTGERVAPTRRARGWRRRRGIWELRIWMRLWGWVVVMVRRGRRAMALRVLLMILGKMRLIAEMLWLRRGRRDRRTAWVSSWLPVRGGCRRQSWRRCGVTPRRTVGVRRSARHVRRWRVRRRAGGRCWRPEMGRRCVGRRRGWIALIWVTVPAVGRNE